MIFYHFTSWQHCLEIFASGEIRTTESNVGSGRKDWQPFGEHVGPDVVWLTTREIPTRNGVDLPAVVGRELDIPNQKWRVRLTLQLPEEEVYQWTRWSKKQRMNPKWRRAIEDGMSFQSWWVIERSISLDEIVSDETTIDGELAAFVQEKYGEEALKQISKGSERT